MIKIKLTEKELGLEPERSLTLTEKESVTSTLFDGYFVIYYQGDEPN